MDYTDYLAGKTKSEMDVLDRLAGRFVVEVSELTVQRFWGGDKLSADEWEAKRSQISSRYTNFFDGTPGQECGSFPMWTVCKNVFG